MHLIQAYSFTGMRELLKSREILKSFPLCVHELGWDLWFRTFFVTWNVGPLSTSRANRRIDKDVFLNCYLFKRSPKGRIDPQRSHQSLLHLSAGLTHSLYITRNEEKEKRNSLPWLLPLRSFFSLCGFPFIVSLPPQEILPASLTWNKGKENKKFRRSQEFIFKTKPTTFILNASNESLKAQTIHSLSPHRKRSSLGIRNREGGLGGGEPTYTINHPLTPSSCLNYRKVKITSFWKWMTASGESGSSLSHWQNKQVNL